ncbi:TPA: hypothetical protein DIS56_03740 [Candidatus Saccharibacteria bacterium]|nr:MAG: hypothetical protein UX30_C0002G0026 [Candidatus Saccharibacteria bacterium GW2011_GWA2_46_10]OGL35798.1 MAG: hypothetical protein A3F05_02070 [Candidatus Saccharibacteria bacterium RIFCSPHIGHO2_12_FULL_47_17]HCM52211.1 hypothetical protein [Candidatus Saccharibacteria bacterium]
MMELVKILKKFILVTFTLSLLMTILIYFKTPNYGLDYEPIGWNCPGIPYNVGPGNLSVGFPFQSHIQTKIYGTCGEISNKLRTTDLFGVLKTWQFYADWIFWSLPLLAAGYLIKNQYAHNRH